MNLTPAEIDADHQLRGRGIHDANVQRIELVPGESFGITLRGTDGIDRMLVLRGLADIGLEHLTNGMIVIYIYVWALRAEADAAGQGRPEVWNTLFGDRHHADQYAADIARAIKRHDGLKLVHVVTAYGGEIAAICREIGWADPPQISGPVGQVG